MNIKIYHNPRCRKSREGLAFVQERGLEVRVVDYIKTGITEGELKEIASSLKLRPEELVRKNEEFYKKQLKGKELSDTEWLRIISENPSLLKRPVVITGSGAVIGDPAENIAKIL